MKTSVAKPRQSWHSPIPTTDGPRIYVKSEFTKICGDDAITGVLLSLLESWHVTKLRAREQSRTYNDTAEKHGGPREHYEGLLQWHTTNEIIDQTCGLMSERTVRQSVQKLVDLGFVSVHKNPDPSYAFDKTRFFLLNTDAVSKAVVASNGIFHADERRHGDDERQDGNDECRNGADAQESSQECGEQDVESAENHENEPSHTHTHTQPTTHRDNDVWSESFVAPTDAQIEDYRRQCNGLGARYTADEWRMAVLALRERQWRQWNSDKIVGDWRAAIERQIGWDRGHNVGQVESSDSKPKDDLPDYAYRPGKVRKYQEFGWQDLPDKVLATWTKDEIEDVHKFIRSYDTVKRKPEYADYVRDQIAKAEAFLERVRKAKLAL